MSAMQIVRRLPSPAPRPLGLAFDGNRLWAGTQEAGRLYSFDPQTWTAREEGQAPGKLVGLTFAGDELRAVVGVGEEDDRHIYRFVPGRGFDDASRIACPDFTGSNLAFDRQTLYLSQAHDKRILALDAAGTITRTIALPCKITGLAVIEGVFHIVSADDAFEHMRVSALDATSDVVELHHLGDIPFVARGLAWDGTHFWSSDRANNEIFAMVPVR